MVDDLGDMLKATQLFSLRHHLHSFSIEPPSLKRQIAYSVLSGLEAY